jgi:hypothetical protein
MDPLYQSSLFRHFARDEHHTLQCALVLLLGFPKRPTFFYPFLNPSPLFIHRYEAFDFFVYVVTLAFLQAGIKVVLESGGAFICIS